ncbi:MAG: 2-isopropylmalate synthase [Xylanivirga thermophila]|jgi:citrate (Re)-synthase|uniref:2-isopropylmalate synthase n=1 Tax=Xylanivirga thermophila TaxID=2496273 RepID=UPI00101D8A2A|nr:2-isopropylmalate synthase [Xylanivirga thermophila]
MLEFSKRSNTLEQSAYKYSLQDIEEPNLYRDLFPYESVPRISFNHRVVPMYVPDDIWITDTTFRDGQQSQAPFTVKQIVDLYDLLHRLSGPNGVIRQSEFFLYTSKDKEALEKCLEKGYEYPEITSWIRATKGDFELVKDMGLKETGILVSCSDYHIFKKLNMSRAQAMDKYLAVVKQALEYGIKPRCHFEDITRADFYGFVVPFAIELRKLMEQTGIPIKIRACDTLGYGVSFPGIALPRSVPGIIYGLRHHAGFPSELLEWHGHNDFYKAVPNSTAAWLYGASSVNCSLLGIGERTGNCPLEAMAIEYVSLRGDENGMDLSAITDIAEYFKYEMGYTIPPQTPFVGKNFNVTRAGIHADGLLKDEEIYNIFDTGAILKRPPLVAIGPHSGLAGIAHWLNTYFDLERKGIKVDKKHPVVIQMKDKVDEYYQEDRTTVLSDEELEDIIKSIDMEFYKAISSRKGIKKWV